MSGAWHYEKAETLLSSVSRESNVNLANAMATAAQAHATLALAYATNERLFNA